MSTQYMELTFIVSAISIFIMIALRTLEIKFQRPIILAHLSWPIEKKLRVHFKKIPAVGVLIKEYLLELVTHVRSKLAQRFARAQEGSIEYITNLQESLRGKRTLSRGSVSFFLLNISDYGNNPSRDPMRIPVESEDRDNVN